MAREPESFLLNASRDRNKSSHRGAVCLSTFQKRGQDKGHRVTHPYPSINSPGSSELGVSPAGCWTLGRQGEQDGVVPALLERVLCRETDAKYVISHLVNEIQMS